MFDKPVTIIGAGPAGLTLARLLQMRGVTVRLYEHDAAFAARDQGGTFDLHADGGQKALIEANLFDEFKQFARPEGQELKIIDMHGRIHYEDGEPKPDDMSRPEIDRQALRNILLKSIDPNTVIWNKHVSNIESLENGKHKLVFKDGSSEITDFLVGADGTWSKVRGLLSSVQPMYTGVALVETRITNPKETAPHIDKLVGHGTINALGENKGLLAQRNGDNSIRVYIALRVPENFTEKYDFSQPNAVRTIVLNEFLGWESGLLEMINLSDDYFVPRHLYSLPIEQHWTTQPGVTIIGDAAHVMSPFAGQGANQAMLDALELANVLTSEDCTNITTLTAALKTFEESMTNRARVFSEESLTNLNIFIREDGPKGAADLFNSFREMFEEMNK